MDKIGEANKPLTLTPGGGEKEEGRRWPDRYGLPAKVVNTWRWRGGRRTMMTRLMVNTRVFIKIKMGYTSSSAWSTLCMWWVWNYLDPILNSLRLSGVAWWADAFFCPSSFSVPLMFEHIRHWIAPYRGMPQLGWQSGDALHLWPSSSASTLRSLEVVNISIKLISSWGRGLELVAI